MEQLPIPMEDVIKAAGSGNAIARALGVSKQAVHQWTRVKAEYCATVERITGIPRHKLRPDLWSPPDDGQNPTGAAP